MANIMPFYPWFWDVFGVLGGFEQMFVDVIIVEGENDGKLMFLDYCSQ